MCYFELIVNSLNIAKIIDDSKTLFPIVSKSSKSSSSKIIDGSKTGVIYSCFHLLSSSSKIIDGSKTWIFKGLHQLKVIF